MTLAEMAASYRAEAVALRVRIEELEARLPWMGDWEREQTFERIRVLRQMWRQCRDISVLCARYYERGYHRNERYTV